jgi:hypothetical protein
MSSRSSSSRPTDRENGEKVARQVAFETDFLLNYELLMMLFTLNKDFLSNKRRRRAARIGDGMEIGNPIRLIALALMLIFYMRAK